MSHKPNPSDSSTGIKTGLSGLENLVTWVTKPSIELVVLFATLALFLISNFFLRDNATLNFIPPLVGLAVVAEIFIFVGMEVKEGAQQNGWKHEIVDTFIALVVALAIWYGASFVLNTGSPVSAVVSCSMLPNLQRGDFVIVQGAPVSAYTLEMSKSELDSLNGPATIYYPVQDTTGQTTTSNQSTGHSGSTGAPASIATASTTINGSLFSYCLHYKSDFCEQLKFDPKSVVEKKGAFTYRYALCPISFSDGRNLYEPCVESVEFHGTRYVTNFSNDVLVYQPPRNDVYASVGDIVHRAFFKIVAPEGKTYYLTRGDNNPILDLQVYDYATGRENSPIPAENLRGRVLVRVPWLGYFKLFISGYLVEDSQCKTQLKFATV